MSASQSDHDPDRTLRSVIMHRLLKRQLSRIYGKGFKLEQLSDNERVLVEQMEQTYHDNDRERRFLEHTIELNSHELNARNRALKQAITTVEDTQRLVQMGTWVHHLEDPG